MIKQQCCWHMDTPADCSWTFRKILGLRAAAFPFIKHFIGNGNFTHLSLDNGHHQGSLCAKFGEGVVYILGRSLEAKVSSIISNGCWRWPGARNAITEEIIRHSPMDLIPHVDCEDKVVWSLTPNGEYSSKSAWAGLRAPGVEVDWHGGLVQTSYPSLGCGSVDGFRWEIVYKGQAFFLGDHSRSKWCSMWCF